MDRINPIIESLDEHRFQVIFGQGSRDIFLTPNLVEVDILHALALQLKGYGYRRIVFIQPDRPFLFLDDESKQLSGSILFDGSAGLISSDVSPFLQSGPLGNKVLLQGDPSSIVPTSPSIGDTHSIRLLDVLFSEPSPYPTVLVFDNAESLFNMYEDQRTLSGVISKWAKLPSTNANRCVFIFSANDYSELNEVARQLPVPEIRSLILTDSKTKLPGRAVCQIQSPGSDEIHRLLLKVQRETLARIPEGEFESIIRTLSSENQLLSVWYNRLKRMPEVTCSALHRNGFLSSYMGDPRPAMERLDELVGLEEIKRRIKELSGWIIMRRKRKPSNNQPVALHMVFSGNPGTGKTTVARLIGELFRELGILQKGHLVEVKASDLVADHVGGTSIKSNQVIDQALDGVLFIDEAYALGEDDRGGFGREAMEAILTRMEDHRDRLVVILAGYTAKIDHLLRSNPGLARRFPAENRFHFPDYSPEQLKKILYNILKERNLDVNRQMALMLDVLVTAMAERHGLNFGNAGEMRNLADSLERRCLSRLFETGVDKAVLQPEDISDEYRAYLSEELPPIEEVLEDFDRLVGLDEIKAFFKRQHARITYDRLLDEKNGGKRRRTHLQNLVFVGNPGTGKTTVARLAARLYRSLGMLRKGHLVEASMPDLIAGYVGQTTSKVMEKVLEALDGVLFIDEAYALVRNSSLFSGSYGQEAIDTLVKAIEDHKDHLVVILAGYPREMEVLLHSNPGLRSRFPTTLEFQDFTHDQLLELLDLKLEEDGLVMPEEVKEQFIYMLEQTREADPTGFGNARELINSYESAKDRLAERIVGSQKLSLAKTSTPPIDQNVFTMADVIGEGYTVVVESSEETKAPANRRLKPWVLSKR